MRGGITATCATLATLFVACSSSPNASNPKTLRDTTGLVFGWSCDQTCSVNAPRNAPLPADCGSGVHYDYDDIRIALICLSVPQPQVGPGVSQFLDTSCRPVACDTSAECPRFAEANFECKAGLCQRIGDSFTAVTELDAVALCLSSVPRSPSCSAAGADPVVQQAETAAQASCSPPNPNPPPDATGYTLLERCQVPQGCRTP